ncbi:hypothetical protein V8G54_015954 [Vigna mungo]|uniref:Uncharacterized protein n=1 Tax=Vigna mungo TaxID=3915 RepID=A0AAQ3RXC2_VIGMU
MMDDSVCDMGGRDSDVGEVQSEDGFTCRSSKIRSQIEPRQYHLSLLTHPTSSDSLVRILLPTLVKRSSNSSATSRLSLQLVAHEGFAVKMKVLDGANDKGDYSNDSWTRMIVTTDVKKRGLTP